ncbi:alpha/beta fold hydrolase [Thioclava sp. FR2]|uniref:alpha/beta fold hydrolase n=1 Tax=Thioclava sp. FR2 TaxID=3445780 RepID=UPI003EBD1047
MKEPILFIPGLMQDARVFLPQMVTLGTGRFVSVFTGDGDTVEKLSEQALNAAPERFAIVGHGLGGNVALDILRRAPERVSRLILLATDPLSEPPQVAATREARMVAAKAGRLKQAIADDVPESALWASPDREALQLLLRDMAYGLGEGVYLRQCRALQRRPDQQKTLRKAEIPALFVAGEHDTVVPLRRQEFARDLMPRSVLKVIPNSGHLPMLENPEAVCAAIEAFLNGPMILR